MNGRSTMGLVFLVLASALGLSAWKAWQEHQEIVLLQAQIETSDRALALARKQSVQYRDRLAKAAKKRADTPPADQAADLEKKSGQKNAPVDLTPYLEKMPEYAKLHQLQLLRQVARQYGDLKNLNLPPEQLDKLKTLLAEKMQAPQDAREAALQAGIEPGSPEMRQAVQSATAGVDTDIKTLVGPDQFASLNNLQMQAGYRNNIEYQIAPDMNAAGLSLSASQIGALAQAQQDAQKAAADAMRNGGNGANFQTIMNKALADQAAKVLTPDQLPVFQQSLSINKQMSDLQAKAREAAQQQLGHPVNSWTVHGP